jgi:FMN phosphatase YigB (HAD superfamily)
MREIDAVCFDFHETLVTNREGRGRGSRLMQYFRVHGLESDPWEHQVLYDVFEPHAREYAPALSREAKHAYLCRLAERVFDRLNVRPPQSTADHAAGLWDVLGPTSLTVFPEVPAVLRTLRRAGIRTAVVSNWQCGLAHYCVELGIGDAIDHVIASAEAGVAKPDARIFREACRRLGTSPAKTLHVGDRVIDDVEGAHRAGLRAVLLRRAGSVEASYSPTIASLRGVLDLLGIASEDRTGIPALQARVRNRHGGIGR